MWNHGSRRVMTMAGGVMTLVLGMTSGRASAQSAWDVSTFGGVFAARSPVSGYEAPYDEWLHTGQIGVSVGRHLTRHLKIDAEAAATGTGRQFVQRFVVVNGFPTPIGAEAETSVRTVAAAATWQFFDNEWVHPFVTAGVQADMQRRAIRVWEQYSYGSDSRAPGTPTLIAREQHHGPETSVRVQPVIGGGVKAYMTPRTFLRADGRASFDGVRQSLAFRAGIGVDF